MRPWCYLTCKHSHSSLKVSTLIARLTFASGSLTQPPQISVLAHDQFRCSASSNTRKQASSFLCCDSLRLLAVMLQSSEKLNFHGHRLSLGLLMTGFILQMRREAANRPQTGFIEYLWPLRRSINVGSWCGPKLQNPVQHWVSKRLICARWDQCRSMQMWFNYS